MFERLITSSYVLFAMSINLEKREDYINDN